MRKKSRTNTYPEFQEPLVKRWMQIGFLTMVFIAVFVMLLLSAIDQRRVLKQSTRRYGYDFFDGS
jgi:capsular polysaccharide biosynthesis protein